MMYAMQNDVDEDDVDDVRDVKGVGDVVQME